MIRRGKREGWLSLPNGALLPWAKLNDVAFNRVVPGPSSRKGAGLLASEGLTTSPESQRGKPLLAVPRGLILSLERVHEHSKIDKDFREVLESLGDFGWTPRGAILTFLLFQTSISCPDLSAPVGVHNPFTDYVKSLPLELLPTFWTLSELDLLVGTTLAPAVSSKLKSLQREYDLVCNSAAKTRWYSVVHKQLTLDDWYDVDAMYRSRALDFPDIGHCMVPCLDIANHASGEATTAIYEKDGEGNAILLLREGKSVVAGSEVTITYGDEKGACEMLFSYGFLEDGVRSAETLFLSLTIPESDIFRAAKIEVAECAPGFKLINVGDGDSDWKGDFVWLLCVNGDDGLNFKLAKTVDGEEELQAFFQDHEITGGAAQLYSLLGKSELWEVYRLRAITILQQRIFDQLQVLYSTQEETEAVLHGEDTNVRDQSHEQAMRLRELEFELLNGAYEDFERQKLDLSKGEVVRRYLAEMHAVPLAERDFC